MNKKLHILYCGPVSAKTLAPLLSLDGKDLPTGYTYPLAAYLIREFHKRGHRLTVISSFSGIVETKSWRGDRFKLVLTPRRRARHFLKDAYGKERELMANAIREANPDIVHAHWTYEFAHVAASVPFPHLVTIRDSPWAIVRHMRTPYRLYRAIYAHFVIRKVANLSAISDYVAAPFKGIFRHPNPIPIIPNGLSSALFAPEEHAFAPTPSQSPCFVSVSQWDPHKNVKMLLQAFAQVRKHLPEARLILIGTGLGADEPGMRWAQQRNLADGVDFLGRMEHGAMITFLRRTPSIFVHSTLEESFCMTILEAMAQKIPVIALPDSGAVPWLLDHGMAGLLAKAQTKQALADAMLTLAKDPTRAQALAQAGYHRSRTEFTLEKIATHYLNLYEQIKDNLNCEKEKST